MSAIILKEAVASYRLPGTSQVVIINGSYQPELSTALPSGVKLVEDQLIVTTQSRPQKPLHLLIVATQDCSYHYQLHSQPQSRVTIIEECLALSGNLTLQLESEIEIGEASQVQYYQLGLSPLHLNLSTKITQRHASYLARYFIHRGLLSLQEMLHAQMVESLAQLEIVGLNFLQDQQLYANHFTIEHLKPDCHSQVKSKSIVAEAGNSDFYCKVIAHPAAIKSKAQVTNKNLLLSDQARANSQPELEIYVDDVECNHGATVGNLEPEAIFYLRSRGLALETSEALLADAFAEEILQLFPSYPRFASFQPNRLL